MVKRAKHGGIGIVSALTLIFIVLKLVGLINWSWMWVLCPLWISILFVFCVFTIILIAGKIKKGKW